MHRDAVRTTVRAPVDRHRLLSQKSIGGERNPVSLEAVQRKHHAYEESIRRYTQIGHELTAEGLNISSDAEHSPADLNVERMSKQTLFQQSAKPKTWGTLKFRKRNGRNQCACNCELSIEDAKRLIEIVHREIHYEHGLMSNQMSWYVIRSHFDGPSLSLVAICRMFRGLAKWFIPH